jgi:hypothetical protein
VLRLLQRALSIEANPTVSAMESEQAILQRLRDAMHRREGVIIAYRPLPVPRRITTSCSSRRMSFDAGRLVGASPETDSHVPKAGTVGSAPKFRLHRILSVRDRPPPRAGYFDFADKVRGRGVRDAAMSVFLDFLLFAMVLGLVVRGRLKPAEYFGVCSSG